MRRRAFFRGVVRWRWAVLVGASVVVAISGALASRVRIDYGVEQLLPSRGEARQDYDAYKALFPREDLRVSLFWEDARPMGPAVLADQARVTRAFEDAGLTDLRRDSARSVWVIHGFLEPEDATDARRRSIERALTAALDTLAPADATTVLSGVPVLRARIPVLLEADQTLFLGGGALLFLGLLFFVLRRPGEVLACLVTVVPAYLCAVGLMAALDRSVTILTSFIPIVVLVVGVSDAIHLVLGWRRKRAAAAEAPEAVDDAGPVVDAFSDLAPSCFYTSLTTAVGFGALAGTGIGVVVEFGLFTAFAIAMTWIFAMTVLPALLSFRRPGAEPDAAGLRWTRPFVRASERFATGPRGRVLAGFAVAAAGALLLATRLGVDTYLVDDLKEDAQVMQDLRWIEEHGFGLFQVNVLVRDTGGALLEPEMLEWMARLEAFGRDEPLVLGAIGLPDLVRHADPALARDLYRPDEDAAQIVFSVRDAGSAATLPSLRRLDRWLEAHPPPAGDATATGLVHLFQSYTARILSSFGPSLLLAGLLIFGIMCFLFRSVRLGLLAMVPNLFPIAVIAGVMAALDVSLKPSTVLVFSIAFAIAVDDSIHLLGALRRELAEGRPFDRAIRGAVEEAGPPILVTTLVVSAGFGLMMLSRFEVLFLVGFLTMTSALAAVAADLVLFPALLRAGAGVRPDPTPETGASSATQPPPEGA